MPATAAPPAPTAAPTTPPPSKSSAPAPVSKPTIDAPAAGEKPPADFMADMIGDFAEMDAGRPAPVRERDKQTGKFKPKEPEKSEPKPEDKEPAQPAEKTDQPERQPAEKQKSPFRELGERYDNLKRQVENEYKPKLQQLEARVKEFEANKPQDVAPLVEKLKSAEEKNSQLEKRIEYLDYASSHDFKTKYLEPYQQAWSEAVSDFKELLVREPAGEDDMGEPKYTVRPATENDLVKLGSMGLSEMDETATKMFGASAARAINHIQNLRKMVGARNRALEEAQSRTGEWKTRQAAEQHAKTEALAKTWLETTKVLEERLPKAFKPDDGDAEDQSAFTRGFAMADLLFMDANALSPEQIETLPASFRETVKAKQPLSEAQRVQLHALARMKMANHDRLIVKLKKAQQRMAELEKTIADYEKSEPTADKAGKSHERADVRNWDTEMAQVEKELHAMDKE